MSLCANCGKGEEASINLKSCAACMLVKYCSRDCQAAHRPQHKKECKRRAAELHDEKLFEQPPPEDDCPICMIRLPMLETGRTYMACCGKIICNGCMYAVQSRITKEEHDVCPFCRSRPPTSDEEMIKRYKKRMVLDDAAAIYNMGNYYSEGQCGLSQNKDKAFELWHRAGELGSIGSALAYQNLSCVYGFGRGVDADEKKAKHYRESAAMLGSIHARHNLGIIESRAGKMDRALRHLMIAVKDGGLESLKIIKHFYSLGYAEKDDYAKALRSYQSYLDEIKSDQRDEAAAFRDYYEYYER